MKRLSVDEIMGMEPCEEYSEKRVLELFGRRKTLSLIQILDLDIPAKDRLWVMFRKGVVEDDVLQRFANVVTDRAVRNHALTHEPTREWAEAWLSGEDRSKEAARAAIERAAVEAWAAWAADAAARAAYWVAKGAAYWAADGAADAAAYAALCAAEAAEAEAAEFELQVEDMRRLLMEAES